MFKIEKIEKWIKAGYEDSKRILSEIFETLDLIKTRKAIKKSIK